MNLIPFSYLKKVCFLSENEDDEMYQEHLELAEDQLSDLLGAEFYEEIKSQFDSGNLSTDNQLLYERGIKKYLAWQTRVNYTGFQNSKATPTGQREFIDENSFILSDVKMYGIERNVGNRLKFFKNKLINFLQLEQEKDSSKYPLYTKCCKGEYDFAITAVDKKSNNLLKVNKSIVSNE